MNKQSFAVYAGAEDIMSSASLWHQEMPHPWLLVRNAEDPWLAADLPVMPLAITFAETVDWFASDLGKSTL